MKLDNVDRMMLTSQLAIVSLLAKHADADDKAILVEHGQRLLAVLQRGEVFEEDLRIKVR